MGRQRQLITIYYDPVTLLWLYTHSSIAAMLIGAWCYYIILNFRFGRPFPTLLHAFAFFPIVSLQSSILSMWPKLIKNILFKPDSY